MCLPFIHASYMFVQWVNPASCFPNISLSTRMHSQHLEALNFGYSYFRGSPKIGSGTSRRPPVSEAWGREFHHGRGVSQTQKPQQPLKASSTWISLEQTHLVLIALHVDHTVLVQTDSECYKSLTTLGKKVVSLQGLGAAVLVLGRVYRLLLGGGKPSVGAQEGKIKEGVPTLPCKQQVVHKLPQHVSFRGPHLTRLIQCRGILIFTLNWNQGRMVQTWKL
jgi:hypothetical protein